MPTVASLYVYPVKSCGGIAQSRACLTRFGLAWDRRWMVIDRDGRFVSQREYPGMTCVIPALTDSNLLLCAPGMPRLCVPLDAHRGQPYRSVTIWKDSVDALDEGEAAAQCFRR